MKYFFIIAVLFLLVPINSCKNNARNINPQLEIKLRDNMIDFLVKKEIDQYQLEGLILPDSLKLFNPAQIKFTSLKNNSKALFFVFGHNNCSVCIDSAIESIRSLGQEYESSGIIIYIISDMNAREMQIFKNKYDLKDNTVLLRSSDYLLEIFEGDPVFFTINDSRIEKLYIHDVTISQTTTRYLKVILFSFTDSINKP